MPRAAAYRSLHGATSGARNVCITLGCNQAVPGNPCPEGGGESGIRTHGSVATTPVFKTGALNRSAISPFYVASRRLRGVAGFASTASMRPPAFGLRVKTGALNRSAISPFYVASRRLRGVAVRTRTTHRSARSARKPMHWRCYGHGRARHACRLAPPHPTDAHAGSGGSHADAEAPGKAAHRAARTVMRRQAAGRPPIVA